MVQTLVLETVENKEERDKIARWLANQEFVINNKYSKILASNIFLVQAQLFCADRATAYTKANNGR